MVSIRAEKVRLHFTRSIRSGVIPEPILLVSARPGMGCADERVRFRVSIDPDGLFSKDSGKPWSYLDDDDKWLKAELVSKAAEIAYWTK